MYHLVYMNEGVEQENSHFAGKATSIVQTNFNPIKIKVKHENNDFNTDVHLLYGYWEIAFKDGTRDSHDAHVGHASASKDAKDALSQIHKDHCNNNDAKDHAQVGNKDSSHEENWEGASAL